MENGRSGLKSWVLAARPKTLPAAIVPVWCGAWLAAMSVGAGSWRLVGFALASCICIQIATNFFNDAIDFAKGADDEDRIGPVRATQSGMLSKGQVMGGALVFAILASLFSFPLILERGWPIFAIGVPSLFLAYGYTGGPAPLAYLGLGEAFVLVFFGWVAVAGTFFVYSGLWSWSALVLGTQVGLLSCCLILINNLRDREGDREVGKRTLAVRFGHGFGVALLAIIVQTVVMLGGYWWWRWGFGWAALGGAAPCLIGVALVLRVWKEEPSSAYNRYLGLAALQLVFFAILFSLGLWIDAA